MACLTSPALAASGGGRGHCAAHACVDLGRVRKTLSFPCRSAFVGRHT